MFPTVVVSLFGLAAATSWGTSDFFAAKASRRTSPEAAAFWVAVIGTLAFAAIYLVYPGSMGWDRTGILYAIAAGISLEIGLFMLFRGLDAGPVSIVSPISSAYPLISTLIALVIFGESLRPLQITGILVAVAGVTIASGLFTLKRTEKWLTSGVMYGILAFLLWGVAYAMLGKAVTAIGWQKSALIDSCAGLIALTTVLSLTVERKIWLHATNKSYKDRFVLATAFLQLLGGIIFTIGLAHARSSAVITTIAATYPALTIFLALKHFKEKRQLIPIGGALLAIVGVVILSL